MPCTDHGLLLSGPMVRAFLRGDKTCTMRPITAHNSTCYMLPVRWTYALAGAGVAELNRLVNEEELAPRILPRHTIWFRETWAAHPLSEGEDPPLSVLFRANGEAWSSDFRDSSHDRMYRANATLDAAHWAVRRWRSPLHMPRWAARCRAQVLSITPRRPCDLTPEELRSEGFPLPADDPDYPGATFNDFWEALHPGKPKNVWCWMYGFKPIGVGAPP